MQPCLEGVSYQLAVAFHWSPSQRQWHHQWRVMGSLCVTSQWNLSLLWVVMYGVICAANGQWGSSGVFCLMEPNGCHFMVSANWIPMKSWGLNSTYLGRRMHKMKHYQREPETRLSGSLCVFPCFSCDQWSRMVVNLSKDGQRLTSCCDLWTLRPVCGGTLNTFFLIQTMLQTTSHNLC